MPKKTTFNPEALQVQLMTSKQYGCALGTMKVILIALMLTNDRRGANELRHFSSEGKNEKVNQKQQGLYLAKSCV